MVSTTMSSGSTLRRINLETFSLVWLDDSVDSSQSNIQTQQQLRSIINHLRTFDNTDECEHHVRSVSDDDLVVMIVSGSLGPTFVPRIHNLRQVYSIYVYCMNREVNSQWAKDYPKIQAVIVKSMDLIKQIRHDHTDRLKHKPDESLALNIFHSGRGQSTTGLNAQFIYSQLLIKCLLQMEHSTNERQELIDVCKQQYQGNQHELSIIDEFEHNYTSDRAIWWYTRQTFLYRLLNKALRVQNIDLIYIFRFFIRDLHQQISKYQCTSTLRAYRGQFIYQDELNTLKTSVGKYISLNAFLSTSRTRDIALVFSRDSDYYEKILFKIDVTPPYNREQPFADVSSLSFYPDESEILFVPGTIFRLVNIIVNVDRLWTIHMVLSNENDYELKPILEHMKSQQNPDENKLLAFGHVLRNMGKFREAENYYRRSLNSLPADSPAVSRCFHALGIIAYENGDYDSSLRLHRNTLKIKLRSLKSNDPHLASSYNSIGTIYERKRDYQRALEVFHKSLYILKQTYGHDHPKVAMCLNNIAGIYQAKKRFKDALNHNRTALKIRKKHLPIDHPDVGASHNNIGIVYRSLGKYKRALNHHNQSLNIYQKSLPPQHPQIAATLNNLGLVYENKKEYEQAIEYYRKADRIYRRALPATHPNLIKTKQFIRRISSRTK